MQKKKRRKSLKVLVSLAMLSAVSIICGKFLALNLTPILRFSLENLPIIFAGAAFGPLGGALVGAVADLIGALIMYGGDINPIITLGSTMTGLIAGIVWSLSKKTGLPYPLRIVITVASAHLIGSVIVKSIALTVYLQLIGLNAAYELPLYAVMLWRLLNYVIVGSVEGVILYFMLKNKAIISAVGTLSDEGKRGKEEN